MLTAEQIQKNWEIFLNNIEVFITGERKQKLLDFYKEYEDRIIMMPAAHKKAPVMTGALSRCCAQLRISKRVPASRPAKFESYEARHPAHHHPLQQAQSLSRP